MCQKGSQVCRAGVVFVRGLDDHEKRIELPLLPVLLPGSDLVGNEHVRNPAVKAEGKVKSYVRSKGAESRNRETHTGL